ncbi:cytochrome P450 [Streptomyces sp. NPDC001691]|uniref:cytochrome P450 family protein n=1 Tax=unclassified Streptomyces TaxID=2593676 RepID=UPI000DEA5028|nr:cytochrome P450 [Streptomyces sp. SDr-06]RCH68788.1 cytochrome P450 [Streptomyces sp. SDr-06]
MKVIDLGAYGEEFNADPHPVYTKLRAEGPAHLVRTPEGGEVWLIVGHEEGRAALADPRLSKDWRSNGDWEYGALPASANMLETDPPQHTRLRKLVAREFTPRRIEALRPRVQEITDRLLDTMLAAPGRTADLVDSLAFPLPMTVICELLGVPDLDQDAFRVLSNAAVAPAVDDGKNTAVREMGEYLIGLIEDKRSTRPGDDLLSALIRTRDEDGDQLSPDELIGMAFLLLVAGHETTVNLISNGIRVLLDHPDQLAALRADVDGLIDGAVEEILRYEGPVETATYRFAREELRIGDVCIAAGMPVLVSLASAGRDPQRHPDPDRFDIRRAPQGHLAFGHGIHFCLGAPLARMEGRIAIRTLLERAPDLQRASGESELDWLPGLLIRGVRHLPVRW